MFPKMPSWSPGMASPGSSLTDRLLLHLHPIDKVPITHRALAAGHSRSPLTPEGPGLRNAMQPAQDSRR